MTTDEAFQDWMDKQPVIDWKDPKEVRKKFIEFGDYVKDRYYLYKTRQSYIK